MFNKCLSGFGPGRVRTPLVQCGRELVTLERLAEKVVHPRIQAGLAIADHGIVMSVPHCIASLLFD